MNIWLLSSANIAKGKSRIINNKSPSIATWGWVSFREDGKPRPLKRSAQQLRFANQSLRLALNDISAFRIAVSFCTIWQRPWRFNNSCWVTRLQAMIKCVLSDLHRLWDRTRDGETAGYTGEFPSCWGKASLPQIDFSINFQNFLDLKMISHLNYKD